MVLGEEPAYPLHQDLVVLHLKVTLQLAGKVQRHVDGKSLPAGVIDLRGQRKERLRL